MRLFQYIIAAMVVAGCKSKPTEIKKTGLEGQLMPSITLLGADSISKISTTDIDPGKPTILFAFEPWCPYCRAQTRSIVSQIKSLRDINIYMLCNTTYAEFKKFYDKYELEKYPNIKAGIDYDHRFAIYFRNQNVPSLAIYDKDKRLKQVLEGKNYISVIRKAALN